MPEQSKKDTKTIAFRATKEDQALLARARKATGIQGTRDLVRHALVRLLEDATTKAGAK